MPPNSELFWKLELGTSANAPPSTLLSRSGLRVQEGAASLPACLPTQKTGKEDENRRAYEHKKSHAPREAEGSSIQKRSGCLWQRAGKPGNPARAPQSALWSSSAGRTHPCSLQEEISRKQVRKTSSRSADLSTGSALGSTLVPAAARTAPSCLPCFRGPSVNCSLDRSQLSDYARTSPEHFAGTSAPARSKPRPADSCRRPSPRSREQGSETLSDSACSTVRAMFGPVKVKACEI